MKRALLVVVVLAVLGAVVGGGLYLAFPVQMSTIGGLSRNYVLSLGAPAGTTTTESNPAYKAAAAPLILAARRSAFRECRDWRLAELQPNRQLGPFLAAWRDNRSQCREAGSPVHVRRRRVRGL